MHKTGSRGASCGRKEGEAKKTGGTKEEENITPSKKIGERSWIDGGKQNWEETDPGIRKSVRVEKDRGKEGKKGLVMNNEEESVDRVRKLMEKTIKSGRTNNCYQIGNAEKAFKTKGDRGEGG